MCDVKHCLSFDCADKTLGVCLIGFIPKEDVINRIEIIRDMTVENPHYTSRLVSDILSVKQYWLFNLLPEAKVRETDDHIRLGRLKAAINSIKTTVQSMNIRIDEVHVEYQMGQNDLSRLISAAIIYEFSTPDNNIQTIIGPTSAPVHQTPQIQIFTIFPSSKNSICFHPNLAYSTFAAKYKTTTTANKHHTTENFKYFLTLQNSNKKIELGTGKHSEINHIADAFMQSMYKIMTNDWA